MGSSSTSLQVGHTGCDDLAVGGKRDDFASHRHETAWDLEGLPRCRGDGGNSAAGHCHIKKYNLLKNSGEKSVMLGKTISPEVIWWCKAEGGSCKRPLFDQPTTMFAKTTKFYTIVDCKGTLLFMMSMCFWLLCTMERLNKALQIHEQQNRMPQTPDMLYSHHNIGQEKATVSQRSASISMRCFISCKPCHKTFHSFNDN